MDTKEIEIHVASLLRSFVKRVHATQDVGSEQKAVIMLMGQAVLHRVRLRLNFALEVLPDDDEV